MWRRVLWMTGWMIGVVILLGSACGPQHRDKGDIEGTVIDGVTQEPLFGVMVSIEPSGSSTQTDAKGMFAFDELSAGFYTVYYSREDYRDAEQEVLVKEGAITQADMAMDPITASITGTVKDVDSGLPLQDVLISTNPPTEQVTTNAEGKYAIQADVTIGETYTIIATKECYQENTASIPVKGGENRAVDIMLKVTPPELSVTPETLDFGLTKNSDQFVIANSSGCGELHWQVSPPQEDWFSVQEPLSGTIIDQSHTVIVNVHRSKATTSGVLTATIHITSVKGGSKIVNIKVEVEIEIPPPDVRITEGPQDGVTISSSEVTFRWEGNVTMCRYRVVNSPYYEDSQETDASSVVLKDLDEGPEHTSYTFEIVAVGEDGRESQPDTRSFRVDAIRGPAVWLRSRRVLISDPSTSPEFTLEVMAEEVVDLLMAHLVMRFDPEQVKIRTVGRGDFLSSRSDPDRLLFFPSDVLEANSSGELIVDMGTLQSNGSPAVSGSGVLVQIRFSALGRSQEAEIYLGPETKFVDASNEDMALKAKIGARVEIR